MLVKSPKRFTRATIRTQAPYVWLLKTPKKRNQHVSTFDSSVCVAMCYPSFHWDDLCRKICSMGCPNLESLEWWFPVNLSLPVQWASKISLWFMGMSARQTPELHHLDVVSKISKKKKGKLRTYLLQLSFGLVGGFKDLLCSILAMG